MAALLERDRAVLTHPQDQKLAQSLLESIDGFVAHVVIESSNEDAAIEVPAELTRILAKVLDVVAHGGTITIGSFPEELTTTVAAHELGVSRPTLMKMIARGDIPAHKVGAHHRLKTSDVRKFQSMRLRDQRKAFDEMRELEDELGEE